MERHVRAAIGAIVWSMMTALAAAQPGIPKGTQLNPGRVTAGAGNFIMSGRIGRGGQSTPPVLALTGSTSKTPAQYRRAGCRTLLRAPVGRTAVAAGPPTPPARPRRA